MKKTEDEISSQTTFQWFRNNAEVINYHQIYICAHIYSRNYSSVADPDPQIFGPPGSGSVSVGERYASGSFYHQTKILRKTLIPTVLWLFFSETWCMYSVYWVPSKSNKQKYLLASWRSMTKIAGSGSGSGSGSISQRHGSADPDPYQNVTDPQHCLTGTGTVRYRYGGTPQDICIPKLYGIR